MAGITLAIGFVLMAGVITGLYFLDKAGILEKIEAKLSKKKVATAVASEENTEVIEEQQEQNIEE